MKEKILIVEDQFVEANNLQMILERDGYTVIGIARSVPIALDIIDRGKPTMVLLDIFLQGNLTGIDLAGKLREKGIAFVYLSANSNKEILEQAKATRPYGFLVKPFRQKDVLVMLEIARYLHEHNFDSLLLKETELSTQHHIPTAEKFDDDQQYHDQNFNGMVGRSPKLRTVLEHVHIVAPTNTSVLILGESGTGKERIADCIHELSPRNHKPFIKVNCAALPATLIESELFGHEKGSFTGATEKRIGKFEQANEGTILLDEIGEVPLDTQVKLLRVLQEREIERIGGNRPIKIDVRIIASTNRDLEKEVSEGRFRMDLYYRLYVFPLTVPPLRERKDDIPLLVQFFVDQYAKGIKKSIKGVSEEVMLELKSHDWPGNIRELQHCIERAVLLTQGNLIKKIPLPEGRENISKKRIQTIEELERDHIINVLNQCGGKIFGKGGAAELLNINVSTLNSKIRKLGIEKQKGFYKKKE